ncbi:D-glycerate 3-kinase [Pseudomassariella vexata]|uniref:D-glycerate 3-kinase n=1 Tax=Pseudomassariella vexata TaxID=1141098 RepID=A0A1Y2DV23_9PEZI|nr:D-glycerate 3-kinase [Pseudomassariella vexata]ORY62984.1 D-glycerate 3-kinase [Pseudomassariella vexata]
MASLTEQSVDDKSPICIPFILERLQAYKARNPTKPLIIGLNGVQGVGKTTLVKNLASTLREKQRLEALIVSIDDFYLKHDDQIALSRSQPDNVLVSCRGEPGTHDMELAQQFFNAICEGKPTKIPSYDKSAFSGQGDRVPESQWQSVNEPGQPSIQVVIFEGWCVGFKPLGPAEVASKWTAPSRTLQRHELAHLQFVNERLRGYDAINRLFDLFVHIDAEDTLYVYDWRLEQEVKLRQEKGAGMTDAQVVKFVDAYYPAYELFSDQLREGLFEGRLGRQLRLVVGKDRKVKQKIVI